MRRLALRSRKTTTLKRTERQRRAKPARMIAYDFETTKIQPGTPRPLYLTAYSKDPDFSIEIEIKSYTHLLWVLETYFLVPEFYGVKFVAWYGNHFDGYIVAAALLQTKAYVLRPYLTRSKSLRGLKVLPAGSDPESRKHEYWEFVDGAAMLGLATTTLKVFLETFAPHLPKLVGVIDFEKERFNPRNKKHCAYAMRDSVGLYEGMARAQRILLDTFNQPLAVTMGGACIKIFVAHLPRGVEIPLPRDEVLTAVRDYVMRGGFCYCARRYQGPVWKYDINQAYAAAMRDAELPCGFTTHTEGEPPANARVYIARVRAKKPNNKAPFYYRSEIDGRMRSLFSQSEIFETWLTSIEIQQLQSEGWRIEWLECYAWTASFTMYDYVSKLETLRTTCEGGPKGAIGTMVKGVGNHSYGKTVEQLEPLEYVVAAECPEGYAPYYGDLTEPFEHVYHRFVPDDEERAKAYHQPQIGAFITAHVRMVLRKVILLSPGDWLYADTDCVVFSRDMTALIDIDPGRYGAWKVEEEGTIYQIIAKKVYASKEITYNKEGKETTVRSSKGLSVKRLNEQDFDEWFEGRPPEQEQVQRNNFLKVMQGGDMYRRQLRHGTAIEINTK
jgi:hypothetical protein